MSENKRKGLRHRVGVVGAGAIVENAHMPVLRALDEVEVAWVTDKSAARARLLADMYGIPDLPIDRFEAALGDVDVCLLATPAGARDAYMEACAARDVAVMCEKPFGRGLEEHQARAARFAPQRVSVCLQRRYFRGTDAMQKMVDGRRFGALRAISLEWGMYDLKSGGPERYLTNARMAGGGVLIENGVHSLDTLVAALRAERCEVVRARGVVREGIDYHLDFDSVLTGPSGATPVHVTMSKLRPTGHGMWLDFDEARVFVGHDTDGPLRLLTPGEPATDLRVPEAEGAVTSRQAFRLLWSDFLRNLTAPRPARCSANAVELTTRWIDQVYAAVSAGEGG